MKDLSPIITFMEIQLKQFFETDQTVGMAVAFTLPPDYQNAHWITNLSRKDGIKLFEMTADKMRKEKK